MVRPRASSVVAGPATREVSRRSKSLGATPCWEPYEDMVQGAERLPTLTALLRRPKDEVSRLRRLPVDLRSSDVAGELDSFLRSRLHGADGSKKVLPGTVRKDLTTLKWKAERMLGPEAAPVLTLLSDVQKGLRKQEATRPATKALPLTPKIVSKLVDDLPHGTATLLLMAWRAASRVDDAAKLRWFCLTFHDSGMLHVSFAFTKMSEDVNETREDHEVTLKNPGALTGRLLKLRNGAGMNDRVFKEAWSDALYRSLAAVPVPAGYHAYWQNLQPRFPLLESFSLHSIKRGAAGVLWELAAEGKLPVAHVMHMLKHKDLKTAVSYAPNPRHVSIAMGTHNASQATELEEL